MLGDPETGDVAIRGGLLIDGSGAAPRRADLLLSGGRISAVGDVPKLHGGTEIDAGGLCVAPGFIDIHSHSDYYLLINPEASSKLLQGVTTEVGGNCGYAAAPVWGAERRERQAIYREHFGIETPWEDIEGYSEQLGAQGISVNYAHLIGHNTVRASAMGMDDRPPTEAEMERMRGAVDAGMRAGAFGLSTGFVYAPACFAQSQEFIELAQVARDHGGLVASHIRSEGDGLVEAIEEILDIGREANIPVQISHLKTFGPANWHKLDAVFERIEAAQAEGLEVHCDRYPYLAANTGLQSVLPPWARAGGVDAQVRRYQDPMERRRLRQAVLDEHPDPEYWDNVLVSEVTQERNRGLEGKSVAACAQLRAAADAVEFLLDLLIDERMQVDAILFTMNDENMRRILKKPYVMVGSDAGCRSHDGVLARGKPHPRGFGAFARVLGQLCRDEDLFDLPTAVRKMTGDPAQKLGLQQRGLLRPGYFADVVIFDAAAIADRATYEEPFSYPSGIHAVFVNGRLSAKDGRHLGLRAGRFLRKGKRRTKIKAS